MGEEYKQESSEVFNLQDFAEWLHSIVKGEMMAKHCQIKIGDQQQKQKQVQKPGRQKDTKVSCPPNVNTMSLPAQQSAKGENKSNESNGAENKPKILIFLLCKDDHRLAQCKQFSSKSVEERAQLIKN